MTETGTELPTSSEYAQQLVTAGVQPTVVSQTDFDKMMAQISALQSQVNQMNVERGVPIDPVDGYRQQLAAHFKARKSTRQDTDFSVPDAAITALPEASDDISAAHTESLVFTMEQWLKQHPGKELDYLGILAGELHQTVLSREGKHGVMHTRVADLETQLAALKDAKSVPIDQFAALVAKVDMLLSSTSHTPGTESTNG